MMGGQAAPPLSAQTPQVGPAQRTGNLDALSQLAPYFAQNQANTQAGNQWGQQAFGQTQIGQRMGQLGQMANASSPMEAMFGQTKTGQLMQGLAGGGAGQTATNAAGGLASAGGVGEAAGAGGLGGLLGGAGGLGEGIMSILKLFI